MCCLYAGAAEMARIWAFQEAQIDFECEPEKAERCTLSFAAVELMSHLYSAMSTVKRQNGFRIAGVLEAAYYLDGMNVEIIADPGCTYRQAILEAERSRRRS